MAPKRAGQMRRDAAMDAMRLIGFKDGLIRRKINELLKVYGRDNWAFIEGDGYKILIETMLESNDLEEPERNLGNDIENRRDSDDNNHNEIPDQENLIDLHPDHTITNHLENQEDTQHITETEVAPVQEMRGQVLPAKDGELASDIPRRKPCFGWISDDEDDELVILERSNQ